MKIATIGAGYVGLVTGVCFADLGHEVICVDVMEDKVEKINEGISPIYERDLDYMLKKNVGKRLIATTDLEYAVKNSEISFICVGTPSRDDGRINLDYIREASRDVGKSLRDLGYHLVVVKSSVVPGTTENLIIPEIEKYSGKNAGNDFGICVNPEFLREGLAAEDTLNPDRIIIGEFDKKSGDILFNLYKKNFNCPILRTNLRTAEMIKYASNNFLATKISFINEISNICQKLDIDVYEVARGMGLDHRIGPHFLNAGVGFGGSCLPKDLKAMIKLSHDLGYEPKLLNSVLEINEKQKLKVIEIAKSIMDLNKKTVTILGLAFKPGTDDIRESPAITIVDKLLKENCKIKAYDPKAMENFEKINKKIYYANSVDDALKDSDLCIILTEWDEFRDIYDKILRMKNPRVIDGRRTLDGKKAMKLGIEYFSIY
ncbi:MAG: UDP-glucose 6-dehydrogenase [Candidatus Altiarchaeales archaeon]|nr:MAG: UDP-glucose 6-dehydrogenase [Candidatus Altiarchaeales archaeon]HDO82163.1 UDP-glucose/GDP-mannose dehydrogenase family protein [Candidatus Altiarchaeales archaeon]HEX54812.1 UDP-glucose/GDP-mannose dehydrogenase family protein [Candidatus Altiarchaeales archaeon]